MIVRLIDIDYESFILLLGAAGAGAAFLLNQAKFFLLLKHVKQAIGYWLNFDPFRLLWIMDERTPMELNWRLSKAFLSKCFIAQKSPHSNSSEMV